MRCIVCVWCCRRGESCWVVGCFLCVMRTVEVLGGITVDYTQAVCCDVDVGRRALANSAGAVVVTAAFACTREDRGGARHLGGGGVYIKCMHKVHMYILSSYIHI